MVERTRLGRGLDFFLSNARGAPDERGEAVVQAPVGSLIPNPHQPRREFAASELKDLAASIKSAGVIQPIIARRVGDRLQIVAGERRWRAAKEAGLDHVPVLIRAVTDAEAGVLALVENLHREDLNAIEKARALKRLIEHANCTQEELGGQVGLDRATVANYLRLLDLPNEVQGYVSRGTLSMGHARALLGLTSSDEQRSVAEHAIRSRLSVRQLESFVQSAKSPPEKPSSPANPRSRPAWLAEIEATLSEVLGASVTVRHGSKRSLITIECKGREEFERVYDQLTGNTPR